MGCLVNHGIPPIFSPRNMYNIKFLLPSGKRTLERLKQQGSAGGSNPMPLINNFNPDFSENKSGMAQWNRVQFKRVEAITRSQTLMDVRAPQGGMTLAEQAELYPVNMSAVSQRSSAKDRYSDLILFNKVMQNFRCHIGHPLDLPYRFSLQGYIRCHSQVGIHVQINYKGQVTPLQRAEYSDSVRTAVSASRSARGSNLVRTSASRHREPDSMFLQKSWSVGASREGNLQSAR
ncbi:hypothetical protein KUTeg_021624 [Tegillarca granosa]|uniref:Uncharacterized protein n=1 Tax=Tegillarca granosa TaxID=220873 RepID=A0ABQ9E9D9_TEGGR|nr:hypothetical protein KUTeg_021624 [Tegillarca granosa]